MKVTQSSDGKTVDVRESDRVVVEESTPAAKVVIRTNDGKTVDVSASRKAFKEYAYKGREELIRSVEGRSKRSFRRH